MEFNSEVKQKKNHQQKMIDNQNISEDWNFFLQQKALNTRRWMQNYVSQFLKYLENEKIISYKKGSMLFLSSLENKKLQQSTLTLAKRSLNAYFKVANLELKITKRFKISQKIQKIIDPAEVKKIKEKAAALENWEILLMVRILSETGCRICELTQFELKQVYKEGEIVIWRTPNVKTPCRKVRISKETYELLQNQWNDLIFKKENQLRESFRRFCEKNELKYHNPHSFRHSVASFLIEKGCPLPFVRDYLGHKNIQTTNTYLHTNSNFLKEIMFM